MNLVSLMLSLSLAALTIFAADLLRFVRHAFTASRLKGKLVLHMLLVLFLVGALSAITSAQTATTTTLAIISGGSAVTTVTSGSVVTLTATVKAGTTPVTVGQVRFCDAAAAHCEDIHKLATSQLTKAGTATYKFIPGAGSHLYKAEFAGTPKGKSDNKGSTSSNAALTVSAPALSPTATGITNSGSVGNYTLTATVGSNGSTAPTGTVSFLDASNSDAELGTATLGTGMTGLHFLNPSNPTTGIWAHAIAVGDFNGDGIPDLAVATCGTDPSCNSNGKVTKLFGNGDGTFTVASTGPPTGSEPNSIAVGDFNGDGFLDLAVANLGDDTVTVLLGSESGTFTPVNVSPATGNNPVAIVEGDFNRDGIPDLAVANENDGTVTILLGNGDGTFTPAALSPSIGETLTGIGVGDFNGDGILDLAVASYYFCDPDIDPQDCLTPIYYDYVTILQGNGDGTFKLKISQMAGSGPGVIAVADFNGDGIPDLALANQCGNDPTCETESGTVTIFLGNGDGTFISMTSPNAGNDPSSISAGDFNGDGIPDLAMANYTDGTATIILGKGDGTFTPTINNPNTGGGPLVSAVGNFNASNIQDLAVVNAYGNNPNCTSNCNGSVTILLPENQTATATTTGIAMPVATGTHQVVASYPGDSDNAASTSGATQLTAAQGTPKVNLVASPNPSPYGATVTLTATATGSGLKPTGTVTFKSGVTTMGSSLLDASGVASIAITSLALGNNSVTANYVGDNNYITATTAPVIVKVNQAVQTITFTAPTTPVRYGVAPITLSASATSGLPVTFSLTGPATLSGTKLTITGVGTVTVSAHQAGNSDYSAAASVTHAIVVDKADLKVTATNASVIYNQPIPKLTYTVTGFVNGDTASVLSGAPVETTTAKQGSAAGKYPITITKGTLSAANYGGFVMVNGTLTITAAATVATSSSDRRR